IGAPYSYDAQAMLKRWEARSSELSGMRVTPIDWLLDDEGRLDPHPIFWVEDLRDVEVTRIRKCANCNNIFWAGRQDKPTCSNECGQVWRQRLSRDLSRRHGPQYKNARSKKVKQKMRAESIRGLLSPEPIPSGTGRTKKRG